MSNLSAVISQDCRRILSQKQQILPRIHCFLWDFTVVMKKQNVTLRIWPFFNSNFLQCTVEGATQQRDKHTPHHNRAVVEEVYICYYSKITKFSVLFFFHFHRKHHFILLFMLKNNLIC